MDLEEKTLDQIGDRCEECGAKLTPAEIQAAMETGGPALCSIHAAEDEPGLAADEAGFLDAWIRPRLPISAPRWSSLLAPAPIPITTIRPEVASAFTLG